MLLFSVFNQDAKERLEKSVVFYPSFIKVEKSIHVSETTIINHGVQQVIILTETGYGTTAKV